MSQYTAFFRPPGDLEGSSVDAGHHAVPEGPGFGAVVVGLHNDGLPSTAVA